MKVSIGAVISISILAYSTISQSISLSYSMLYGSPWTNETSPACYGPTYGVFNRSYTPGARDGHRIIVYSNLIYSFHGRPSPRNDVWAFNLTSKTWAWMAGNSISAVPSFGSLGVASVLNTPGYRLAFGGDIHRARGEYIIFGGYTTAGGYRGDLWSFDLASNMWTWLAGKSSTEEVPIYNSMMFSSTPGARDGARCVVYPKTGELLLYGGFVAPFARIAADMWAFNFNNLEWTFISGSSAPDVSASIGPKGVWSTGYYPESRFYPEIALSSDTDILYLFAGSGNSGHMNDLWAFKRDTLRWAWIGGSSTPNSSGICGTMGYPNLTNCPSSRYSHRMIYHSPSRLLVVYGGYGWTCAGTAGKLSDTWAFNTSSFEWTWLAGSSAAEFRNSYSVLGAQESSAIAIDFDTHYIYIFGGLGYVSQSIKGKVDYLWNASINNSPEIQLTTALLRTTYTPTATSLDKSVGFVSQILTASSRCIGPTSYLSSPEIVERGTSQTISNVSTILEADASGDSAKNSATLFLRLRSMIYTLIAGSIVVLLIVAVNVACKFSRRHEKTSEYTTGEELSLSLSSYQTDSYTMSSATGETTLSASSIGIYLPGGLQVDGTLAYRKIEEVARGGGGSVWLATALEPSLKTFGVTVIVKIPNAQLMNERAIALFRQEISLMNAFKRSQNIATLLGYSETPFSTILKYYPNGSLSKWMLSSGRTLFQAHAFMKDISLGIALLHSNGVVHCDLKPDNVLIESGWRLSAIISDFGISRIVTNKLLTVGAYEVQHIKGASLAYAAPEVIQELRGGKATRKSPNEIMARDIFAVATILTAVLNGKDVWK